MATIKAKRLALQYHPPTIILQYACDETGRLRMRSMPVRGVRVTSDPEAVAQKLVERHPEHLGPNVVPLHQITRLCQKIIDNKADLCKATDAELDIVKARMEKDFVKNAVKPGDESYEYDVRKDFEPDSDASWDDDMPEDGW